VGKARAILEKVSATLAGNRNIETKGNTPMTTMTDNEWRSFVTAGTRLPRVALPDAELIEATATGLRDLRQTFRP
jgi:hypothetical protein